MSDSPAGQTLTVATSQENKPVSRQRGYHGAHGFYHGQKPDNRESGLPFQVKQAIIEYSHLRSQIYEPEKVNVRTENRYYSRDPKQVAAEKVKRNEDVQRRGFSSDAKESYKPLGEPITDSDTLIYKTLRLDPSSFQKVKEKNGESQSKSLDPNVSERTNSYRGAKHESGMNILKQRLIQSKKRIHIVKSGVSFCQSIEDEQDKIPEPPKRSVPEGEVDWMNLKIDTDKQNFFAHLHERHRVAWNEPSDIPVPVKRVSESEKEEKIAASHYTKPERSKKEIEEALNIVPNPSFPETMQKFFLTREKFYEQQQQLNQILNEDLSRIDSDRKNHFVKKYSAFEVRKGGMFSDDMRAMRFRAEKQRLNEKKATVSKHAWFQELESKVYGNNKHPSKLEELLLDRIKCYIEDKQEFNQSVFIQLMKLIPQRVFNDDPFQRIIRFVKQHSSLSEREFLEAIELSNHEMKMSLTIQLPVQGQWWS